ncbi:hypothetical protein DDI_2922 [Dickeya dianthicola RNS04.9]|nr:hypothetical protein DDI_2922 [Dickeya dianthicola RNS04.9]
MSSANRLSQFVFSKKSIVRPISAGLLGNYAGMATQRCS